ncbi:MAG: IS66 family insertion sequence element accessory protein TnpB [Desulfitobacteriaceae bacterium]|nr:IS66 family insertion sequence element accessory protein TnpB [Desulfitobacteriaceae bacterium]
MLAWRTKCKKILQWEHNGFWLHYRRLERGKFNWPTTNVFVVSISYREFRRLMDGLSLSSFFCYDYTD